MKKMMWNAHDDGFGPYINLSKQNQKKTDILIKTRVKGMGGGRHRSRGTNGEETGEMGSAFTVAKGMGAKTAKILFW